MDKRIKEIEVTIQLLINKELSAYEDFMAGSINPDYLDCVNKEYAEADQLKKKIHKLLINLVD